MPFAYLTPIASDEWKVRRIRASLPALLKTRRGTGDIVVEVTRDAEVGKRMRVSYGSWVRTVPNEETINSNPRMPRKRKFQPPYRLNSWFERDRGHVELVDALGATVVEWWDEDLQQAVEDGFLEPRRWLESATEYAKSMGLI